MFIVPNKEKIAIYLYKLASGTNAANLVALTYLQVPLNFEYSDPYNIGSLVGNAVVLAKGKYHLKAECCFYQNSMAKFVLAKNGIGISATWCKNFYTLSYPINIFRKTESIVDVNGTDNISFFAYSLNSQTNGLGLAVNTGSDEVFGRLTARKIA